MATAKWTTPGSASSNFAGSSFNSVANGNTSAFVTYDNSSNLDLYGAVVILLGSITATTGASITLRIHAVVNGSTPDDTGSVGGGDTYTVPVTATTGAKVIVIPMVRLPPFSLRFQITNNTGATLNTTGNSLVVVPYNEGVS